MDGLVLRVLTLNCWGLWFGSKCRADRMRSIVKHLNENSYDIVFLQEVWVTSDFEIIRDGTRNKFKFAHLFRSGSILGSSGIVILCRWYPRLVHFEPYSLNGSPFYPWHGDWFAGKGVAYTRVDFNGLSLHLFSTHMHAYYNDEERIHDQYSIHRICQSYQMARFINFISDTARNRQSNGKDLIIVAGDMNSTSSELPYKILTTMTGLVDCYKMSSSKPYANVVHNSESFNSFKASQSSDTEDDDITYCHPRNSFTPLLYCDDNRKVKNDARASQNGSNLNGSNKPGKLRYKSPKKRIDFILVRLLTHGHCLVDRFISESKDPITECSLSDHEPVVAELQINDVNPRQTDASYIEPESEYLRETTGQWLPDTDPSNPKHACNVPVIDDAQKILDQYRQYNKTAKTQLLVLATIFLLGCLPTATYFALANESLSISAIVLMWFLAGFVYSLLLLAGFLCYRFEQASIDAIINDMMFKIAVSKQHMDTDDSGIVTRV